MSSKPEITFEVQIKRLDGLPPRSIVKSLARRMESRSSRSLVTPLAKAKRRWYTTLDVGLVLIKTAPTSRGANKLVVWDETFPFTTTRDACSAKLALYRAYGDSFDEGRDEKVAEAEALNLIDFIFQRDVKEVTVGLVSADKEDFGKLTVQFQPQLPQVEVALMKTYGQPFIGQLSMVSSAPESWQRFLSAFQQAVELARQIAELNSTAKAAVGVISFALTALVKQIERDERVNELRDLMSTLLLFFRDIESLQQNPFLRKSLDRLLRQASECTYFIFQYQQIESLIHRTAVHLTSNTDTILNQFFTTFTTIRAELLLGTSLQAVVNTEYILNKVNEIDVSLHINRLQHLEGSGRRVDKKCSPNSQEWVINRIMKWISGFERCLYVLAGPPGFGKSGVLHTIAEALDENGRLGAGIFLNEHTRGEKTADVLMRTILYYLALSHPCIGKKIASAIKRQPSLDSADAARCATLLVDITEDLAIYGPLVVIIDGSHEFKNPEDRVLIRSLLRCVAERSHDNLRFILSTREIPTNLERPTVNEKLNADNQGDIDSQMHYDEVMRLHSAGSLKWTSLVYDLVEEAPQLMELVLLKLGTRGSIPTSENDALHRLGTAVAKVFGISPLYHDFCHIGSGSRLFTPLEIPDNSLDGRRALRKLDASRIQHLNEYEVSTTHSLSVVLGYTGTPLIPTDSSLNIYQTCLRDASKDGQGPVYARIALPVSEPLVDGRDIKNEFWYLGCGIHEDTLNKMLANSSLEGCEWIILHHRLLKSESKDGYTSVMATAPVMTQATLERLVCIWVDWGSWAAEGTCVQIRDGEETGFLARNSFNKAVYHGTHSELSDRGEKRGDLRPGDQIQVRVKYDMHQWFKDAFIAMALKY